MKKLLLGLSLLTTTVYGQKCEKESYFSVSVLGDIRNCTIGSDPTNNHASPNLLLGAHAVGNNFEMNPEVEIFPKIGYWSAGLNFGYHINNWYIPVRSKELNLTLVPLAGLKLINRYNQQERQLKNGDWVYEKSSHYAFQVGGSLRLQLSDKWIFDLTSYLSTAPDIKSRWPEGDKNSRFSTYGGFHYILN